ncbi:MAG: hypothetical protein ACD_21C00242G0005 [uncultured bacterium]|nr:MAG: hypothetical protein ACD_21C00242G0005 [uncultured bacterium]
MTESEFDSLESQIDSFIEHFQQLTIENSSLHKKVTHLSQERASLLEKKKQMAASLKTIILQLQDELSCPTQ